MADTAYAEMKGAMSEVQTQHLGEERMWEGTVGLEPLEHSFETENGTEKKTATQLLQLAVTIGGFKEASLKDRGISLDYFRQIMGSLSPEEALALFTEIDTNQNGFLSRLEIICYLYQMDSEIDDKKLKQELDIILCFQTYSRPGSNNSAVLTAEDLLEMIFSLMKCTTYKSDGTLREDSQLLVSRLLRGFSSDKKHHAYLCLDDFRKALYRDAQTFMPVLEMWRFLLLGQEQEVAAKALALERQRLCVCCTGVDLLPLDPCLASSLRYVEDLCVIS